ANGAQTKPERRSALGRIITYLGFRKTRISLELTLPQTLQEMPMRFAGIRTVGQDQALDTLSNKAPVRQTDRAAMLASPPALKFPQNTRPRAKGPTRAHMPHKLIGQASTGWPRENFLHVWRGLARAARAFERVSAGIGSAKDHERSRAPGRVENGGTQKRQCL